MKMIIKSGAILEIKRTANMKILIVSQLPQKFPLSKKKFVILHWNYQIVAELPMEMMVMIANAA